MRVKDHYIEYLVLKLSEEGILNNTTVEGGKQTVHSWIRRGLLKLRQRPYNKYYVVSDNEIEEIVREFSPGGKGWWSFDGKNIIVLKK